MGISYLLRRAVQTRPNHTALIFGDRRQTWSQFHDRVTRLAGGFAALGVAPDDRIAAIMDNNDRYSETLIATPVDRRRHRRAELPLEHQRAARRGAGIRTQTAAAG